jgi:sulfur-oxidizing protein SoxX
VTAGPVALAAAFAAALAQADAMTAPLTDAPGNPARGRAIVADRQAGMCLLCHRAPVPEERFQGTIGPDLAGVGARLSAAQLRLRIVDMQRLHPQTVMPAYHRVEGLARVAPAYDGKPILDAQQVEDVVAFLATLR